VVPSFGDRFGHFGGLNLAADHEDGQPGDRIV
jgi:hypothetical protein